MSTTTDAVTGDPIISHAFILDITGGVTGYFMEVSGLGSENDIVEHKIMAENNIEVIRKQPGRTKWSDITLKRGITANMDMWEWFDEVFYGNVSSVRVNGSIMMLDQEGTEVARWDFTDGWPSKITGPQLQSDSSAVGVEELTIVHEGIIRVS